MASIWWCTQYTRRESFRLWIDGEFNYEILIGLNCGESVYNGNQVLLRIVLSAGILIEIFMNYSTRLIITTLHRQHINTHTHKPSLQLNPMHLNVCTAFSSVSFFLLCCIWNVLPTFLCNLSEYKSHIYQLFKIFVLLLFSKCHSSIQ